MKIKKFILMVLSGIIMQSASPADAQDTYYFGINIGVFNSIMRENFTRHAGGVLIEKNTFENAYNGQYGGLYLGYRMIDTGSIFTDLQVHVNVANGEVGLQTASSDWVRKLDYNFGIDFQPGLHINEMLSAFIDFSLERGRFKFTKTGSSTTHDSRPDLIGYGFGVGFALAVSSNIEIKAQYRFSQYDTTTITSTLEELHKIDQALLTPTYNTFILSIQYNVRDE